MQEVYLPMSNREQENNGHHYLDNQTNEPTSLHHRKNPHSKNKSEKQFTSQLNFMRFIFRYLEMFPPLEESGRYTFGLRFLSTKQLLSQLVSLKDSLSKDNNCFNF